MLTRYFHTDRREAARWLRKALPWLVVAAGLAVVVLLAHLITH